MRLGRYLMVGDETLCQTQGEEAEPGQTCLPYNFAGIKAAGGRKGKAVAVDADDSPGDLRGWS